MNRYGITRSRRSVSRRGFDITNTKSIIRFLDEVADDFAHTGPVGRKLKMLISLFEGDVDNWDYRAIEDAQEIIWELQEMLSKVGHLSASRFEDLDNALIGF